MWFFSKKAPLKDFLKFKANMRSSARKQKKEITIVKQKYELLQKELNTLKPLSKKFSELQTQFIELMKQFSDGSVNCQSSKNSTRKSEIEQKNNVTDKSALVIKPLTPLEQKAFIFIGKLQNESGGNWIPVGSLTSNLYPDQLNRKIKTTVSNVLKTLSDLHLVMRERKGNYWFIRLSKKGFESLRKELNEKQLKGLIEVYNK